MRRIVIEDPGNLGTLNLKGLKPEKWEKVNQRLTHKEIPLREDPRNGRLIILDGHHTSAVCMVRGEPVKGIIYDDEDEIEDAVQKLNFGRALKLNDVTSIKGEGTLREMVERFKKGKTD